MTQDKFISFLRGFRRPYASVLCATTLCASVVIAAFTGNWIPAALAAVLAGIIVADTAARSREKTHGSEDEDA